MRPLLAIVTCCAWSAIAAGAKPPNLNDIPDDLRVPEVTHGTPKAGARVWQTHPRYEGFKLAHALYLPTDWKIGQLYPVFFEYPGNGNYENSLGDKCDGTVESCQMGYGLSGGRGAIWVSLPFVDPRTRAHARVWWGDPEETVKYCKETVARICREYGGDPKRLVLMGFSRGAIACNYIGLRDEEIASLWCGFIAHSHYDGVRQWDYADSDGVAAKKRLERLGTRPQLISQENSTQDTEAYLKRTKPEGHFTFITLPYPNHSLSWVRKDLAISREARQWLAKLMDNRTPRDSTERLEQ
jgi:hypothetical protein